ncbi:MAG TPA: PKD domain-containing protein, partial [Thermoplasmata archaeon]|nr:PKD domain-containing protein [Thermoplasmata archaeon]
MSGRREERALGTRGLGGALAAVVIVVVLAVAGAGTYFALNATKSSPVLRSSCSPAISGPCQSRAQTHDVSLLVPFKATQEGTVVPFTATLPSGESASSFTFNFGDGVSSPASNQPIASHVYSSAGTYLVSALATVGGVVH